MLRLPFKLDNQTHCRQQQEALATKAERTLLDLALSAPQGVTR